jgi:4'-phosphopantetheinyl transferase EntD
MSSALGLENPSTLSPELTALFPAGVIAAELSVPAPRSLLTPAELQFISHCANKRIEDFTAGRACAHRALRELGSIGFSLLAGKRREPIWPDAIVGSITHTQAYAAAAVARQSDLRSVGIDCERIDAVREHLWPRICAPTELDRLARIPADESARHAALIFAAKEAFYKCQFPMTGQWVGFEDVVIESECSGSAGTLRIIPQKKLSLDASIVAGLVGRFLFRGASVIAAVSAPN